MYGVGYNSGGNYSPYVRKGVRTDAYQCWNKMLERCYSKNYDKYNKYTCCKDWLDFQGFASWYYDNIYLVDDEPMELDKDLLSPESREFNPDTCMFIPRFINKVINNVKYNKKSDLPTGISWNKKHGDYVVRITMYGKRRTIGNIKDKDEASELYNKARKAYIYDVAHLYKDRVPEKLYNALMKKAMD